MLYAIRVTTAVFLLAALIWPAMSRDCPDFGSGILRGFSPFAPGQNG